MIQRATMSLIARSLLLSGNQKCFFLLSFGAFVFRGRFQAEGLFEGRRDPLALPAPQRLVAPPCAEADRGGRRQLGEG